MESPNEQNRVVFEGEQFTHARTTFASSKPTITQWLVKNSDGLLKNEQQAQYILVGFAVCALLASLYILFDVTRSPSPPPADEIINVAGPAANG